MFSKSIELLILIIITYEQRHRGDNVAASGAPYLSVARLTRV